MQLAPSDERLNSDAARSAIQDNPDRHETALDLFRACDGAAIAITYFDCSIDFRTVDDWSDRMANWLLQRNVQTGDRVALVLQNTPDFMISCIAAWKVGATVVPLNPMYRGPELKRLFGDCEPSAVICHDDQWALVSEAAVGVVSTQSILWTSPHHWQTRSDERVIPARVARPAGDSMDSLGLASADLRTRLRAPRSEDIALLLYTSGTTGIPKGGSRTFRANRCALL